MYFLDGPYGRAGVGPKGRHTWKSATARPGRNRPRSAGWHTLYLTCDTCKAEWIGVLREQTLDVECPSCRRCQPLEYVKPGKDPGTGTPVA